MSQSDTWLLIYGREKAKKGVASKTSLLLFSSDVKSKQVPKKWLWRRIKIFANYIKGLAVFSIHKSALSIPQKCGENLNTKPEFFL